MNSKGCVHLFSAMQTTLLNFAESLSSWAKDNSGWELIHHVPWRGEQWKLSNKGDKKANTPFLVNIIEHRCVLYDMVLDRQLVEFQHLFEMSTFIWLTVTYIYLGWISNQPNFPNRDSSKILGNFLGLWALYDAQSCILVEFRVPTWWSFFCWLSYLGTIWNS